MAEVHDTADGGLLDFTSNIHHYAVALLHWPTIFTPTGIILTDAAGRIVHTNSAADGMLDGRVLLCVEDQLSARDSRSAADLQTAIAEAGRVRRASRLREVISLIAKGPGSRAIAIWVMSLDNNIRLPLASALAARIAVFAQEVGDYPPMGTLIRRLEIPSGKNPLLALLSAALGARPIPAAAKR